MRRRTSALLASGLLATTLLAGCTPADQNGTPMPGITPLPVSFELHEEDAPFRLAESTRVRVEGDAGAAPELLAERLRAATGWEIPVVAATASGDDDAEPGASDILIVVAPGEAPDAAAEGYTLEVSADGARIGADTAAGAFWGTQSLRQLLPPAIERPDATEPAGGWTAAAASVTDAPRFAYRAAMLDVARHFFPVEDVEGYLDQLALLKFNVLHLHLTDDQGWRIEIPGRPELTGIGAATSVGGDGGGFYTADDYRRIVGYAADRQITVVPEIDLPGHTNAALSADPELNCDGVAPAPYEGIEVGFSSLCASPERAEATDRFLADVLGTVASLTPGPYLHVGGDESHATPEADYLDLVRRITAAAAATGKTVIAWHEAGSSTELPAGTIGQYWNYVEPENDEVVAQTRSFVEQGGKVVMSPADAAYLDMKYVDDPQTALGRTVGLQWAKGPTTLDEAYAWEPTAIVPGVGEQQVLGVEAPIWTETLSRFDEVEFMVFPRITAIAEIAWSPMPAGGERDHDAFFERVARLGERWDALGVTYYPMRGVPWTR
ncbi:beta-N-acetylhexosaminidase [Agromyces larvae]|uniref:beta-N-acetylhexosaminidase n=1 Tax=Agromyces larvae TaxID=2929802 RepID=A0ABY4BTK6_9MICO|nr:beta-N-acetylhexosaminidase [Agromyces larvae]UOE42514.1 beta-N-acetylhexosaminidase [Agromyces larvae]